VWEGVPFPTEEEYSDGAGWDPFPEKSLVILHIKYRNLVHICRSFTSSVIEPAVMEVIDNIYNYIDQHEYVIGISLDLQKAFNTVNHDILLHKLYNYGIRGVVHQWFKSYLSKRHQFISLGDSVSCVGHITTGVPQGSVLGPLLFLLYVNDICYAVPDTKIKLFADDTN